MQGKIQAYWDLNSLDQLASMPNRTDHNQFFIFRFFFGHNSISCIFNCNVFLSIYVLHFYYFPLNSMHLSRKAVRDLMLREQDSWGLVNLLNAC